MTEDRPRFVALTLSLAAACALSWLLMGGAEMIASVAERQGTATAAAFTGGGFVAWALVLYLALRVFHWTWTRLPGAGG